MSRTKRTKPTWAERWARNIEIDPHLYGPISGDVKRNKWLHGRDGIFHDICAPSSSHPKGYDTWETTGYPNRRWAKRGRNKIIRSRSKREMHNESE